MDLLLRQTTGVLRVLVWAYISLVFLYLVRFYWATLCVSAVFAVGRRPSVCLSVMFVYYIQTAEDQTSNFFLATR